MPDVLVSGSERPERRVPPRLRRTAAAGLAVLLLAAGGVAVAQDRARDRDAREQDAAGEVQRARLAALSSPVQGGGRLLADVTVTDVPRGGTLSSVRLEGDGLTPVPAGPPVVPSLPTQVPAEATVDCRSVPQRLPERAQLVLTVVERSRLPLQQRLSVAPAVLREAVLEACDAPDPAAEPVVEVSAQDSRLLLYVETVPRSDADVRIEDVTVPGFAVAGPTLPYRLPPDSGGVFGFSLRVTDCARASTGGPVTVRLSEDGRATDRVAARGGPQSEPHAVPLGGLLRGLAAAAC